MKDYPLTGTPAREGKEKTHVIYDIIFIVILANKPQTEKNKTDDKKIIPYKQLAKMGILEAMFMLMDAICISNDFRISGRVSVPL